MIRDLGQLPWFRSSAAELAYEALPQQGKLNNWGTVRLPQKRTLALGGGILFFRIKTLVFVLSSCSFIFDA